MTWRRLRSGHPVDRAPWPFSASHATAEARLVRPKEHYMSTIDPAIEALESLLDGDGPDP